MSFTGWPDRAFEVLLRLDGEPTKAFRESLRKEREHLVREPMIALLNAVADADPAYEDFSVWGYGKTVWWWQHQVGVVRMRGRHELSLRFDLDGLRISGGGSHRDLGRYRAAVLDETTGPDLVETLESLQKKGFEISGEVMKRNPRGAPPDHPRADLLRQRTLVAGRQLLDEYGPEVLELVLQAFGELPPLMAWFGEHASVPARP